jgi:hypothetical protein
MPYLDCYTSLALAWLKVGSLTFKHHPKVTFSELPDLHLRPHEPIM